MSSKKLEYQPTTSGGDCEMTGGSVGGIATLVCSALPFAAFLTVYSVNGQLGVLPRPVDVACLRLTNISEWERRLFAGLAPHELVAAVHNAALDYLAALPYLLHYAIPVAYPAFIVATDGLAVGCRRAARFNWLLGWTMWLHFVVWFAVPTAPPWAADALRHLNGTTAAAAADALLSSRREGCAFARIDRRTGVPLFRTIYAGNPVPFASFPSGHVAWPTCVLATWATEGCRWRRRALLGGYVAWVSWATMYTCHHYLLDILAAFVIVVLADRLLAVTCLLPPCYRNRKWRVVTSLSPSDYV